MHVVLKHGKLQFVSYFRKTVHSNNMHLFFFSKMVSLQFYTGFSAICGTFEKQGPFWVVWEVEMEPRVLFIKDQKGAHFGKVGALSASVQSATECQMRVNDVICAMSSSGTMQSAMSVLLEKTVSVIFLLPVPLGCLFFFDSEEFLSTAPQRTQKYLYTLGI